MEKSFPLQQHEQQMLQAITQERTNALAAFGALTLDMEAARKTLEAVQEKQNSFLRSAVLGRGIERCENVRASNGAIHCTVPDEQPAPRVPDALAPDGGVLQEPETKVNGAIAQ
jgi:hypothetical protein